MQLTSVFGYNLLIFAGCLVLHIQCQNRCGKEKYTVVRLDGSFYCLNCGTCIPGLGLHPPCGRHLQEPLTGIECKVCPTGKFNDEYDSSPCHSCQQCAKHEIVAVPCTNKSDRSCNGTCENGFFYSKKDSTHSCQKCSYCCFDGKDEEVSECTNQGLNASKRHCRPRPDKNCSPFQSLTSAPTDHGTEASKSGGLSQTTIIVVGVIGAVIAIVAVIVVIYLHRRKKKQGTKTAAQSYAMNGPTVHYNSSYTPSHTVTPAVSHEGLPAERRVGAKKGTKKNHNHNQNQTANDEPTQNPGSLRVADENKPAGLVATDTATASVVLEEAAAKLDAAVKDDTRSGMGSFSRQSSKESQKSVESADAGSGRWKRSPSTSSFTESLKRRLSTTGKRDECLVHNEEEGADEGQGPITITQEPSSQEAKEGSKVELVFKCKARGNSKLVYQWFKDDTELRGKNDSTLLIKSVTLPDFGSYKCHARIKDGASDVVESSPAELDITPRDGTKYKCLNKIDDPYTQDRIGTLLTQKKHGLGGWRQVAFKYGMDQLYIKSLQDDPEAGQKTLEHLDAHNPDLTVYDFCKTLKEYDIRRFDIVKELMGHLSIQRSSTVYV